MTSDFTTLILSISSAATMGLGGNLPSSKAGATAPSKLNLELASHNIELLQMLQTKTQGNLTPDEDKLLTHLLFELRMKFVEVKSDLSKQK